uniref:chemerin-like receptor 1 n=1 Tax=Pristiophorus japonicus TaxID=55135 RepID=UPI00398E48A2
MEPEEIQLTQSSEVLHHVSVTEDYSSGHHAMYAFINAIFITNCILGMLGNGLVIWATGFKLKRTANTVWLLSLAVADFTVSLLLPLFITEFSLDFNWPFGRLLCKLNSGALALCLNASIFILVAISVDRCISVALPIWSRNHRSPRLATQLSLGVWVVAAMFSMLTFVFCDTVSSGNRTMCNHNYLLQSERAALNMTVYGDKEHREVLKQAENLRYARYRAVTLSRFLGAFLLPFLVIAASYAIIGLRLRWDRLAPSRGKLFRVIASVVLAFLLCWAPYHFFSILRLLQLREEPWPLVLSVGVPLSYSLACMNSCINPVLYIFMWQDFRDLLNKSLQRHNSQGTQILRN